MTLRLAITCGTLEMDSPTVARVNIVIQVPELGITESAQTPDFNPASVGTPAAAITTLKNRAIAWANDKGLTVVANEVFIFGGPQ